MESPSSLALEASWKTQSAEQEAPAQPFKSLPWTCLHVIGFGCLAIPQEQNKLTHYPSVPGLLRKTSPRSSRFKRHARSYLPAATAQHQAEQAKHEEKRAGGFGDDDNEPLGREQIGVESQTAAQCHAAKIKGVSVDSADR